MRLITNKEKFTNVNNDFLLSTLENRDMVTFLKTAAQHTSINKFLKKEYILNLFSPFSVKRKETL